MFKISFRNKILATFAALFLLFLVAIYFLASHMVYQVITSSIQERVNELIAQIRTAPNEEAMVQKLKDQKYLIFSRVSIITQDRQILYDSYAKRLAETEANKEIPWLYSDVDQAFREGYGSAERESKNLNQSFIYVSKAFDFQGKSYVLRTAFPYQFVNDLTDDVEVGLIIFSAIMLLLFSALTWLMIHRLTQPISQIITTIRPYQEGQISTLPKIHLNNLSPADDFSKLGETLNSLSARIQSQIDALTSERNEKKATLESLVEGVVSVDEDMKVTYANQTALKHLGFEQDGLIGQNFEIAHQPKCFELLKNCQRDKKVITDTIEIREDGKPRVHLDLVAAPKSQNKGAVLVMEDKTVHYKLLDMRRDFIANASHELKTPITIIRGFAETLQDNPNLPPETYNKVTGKIINSCQRMANLIKDLLALTDIENIPESRLIECDLDDLVQRCCQMVGDLFPDAVIAVHKLVEGPIHLMGDPNLLEMAITNLLENAGKYSPSPAHITVTMDIEGENVKLSIADKGIGIPSADLEHIFERFYTVDKAHSRKLGGSGLGLSIVHTIVEKHFGKITVASTHGQGTTFIILLPIERGHRE